MTSRQRDSTATGRLLDSSKCRGIVPLDAQLEPWMTDLVREPMRLHDLVRRYGSPLHLHRVEPMVRNLSTLHGSARDLGVCMDIFFARKANKCISYLDGTMAAKAGVDVASRTELEQTLDWGVEPRRIVVTAAVKPQELLELCAAAGVQVVLDNEQEAERLGAIAHAMGRTVPVAVRLCGFRVNGERLASRFGFDVERVLHWLDTWATSAQLSALRLEGLHFHLDGYDPTHRVAALDRCLELSDELALLGRAVETIDIGGGFPMTYLEQPEQWEPYWRELDRALLGQREPITYRNHGFGLIEVDGATVGRRQAYPLHEERSAAQWLHKILSSARPTAAEETIAEALCRRQLRLACEPGRAALDGCGLTVARVEHTKIVDGDLHVALAMNGSNCRSKKSEHFVDPMLVPATERPLSGRSAQGYLTGAYCTESDLVVHRKLRFPLGALPGDLVLFPNTAGYLMHFVESRSHQFPLPKNVFVEGPRARLDPIDRPQDA